MIFLQFKKKKKRGQVTGNMKNAINDSFLASLGLPQ